MIFDADALRPADRDRDDAAILGRRQLLGQQRVGDGRRAGEDERDRDHDDAARQAPRRAGGDRAARRRTPTASEPPQQRIARWRGLARRAPSGCARRASGMSVSATSIGEHRPRRPCTKPNSEKSRPAVPGKNEIGMNTAASVAVVASTAKNTCRAPSTAAARGPMPMRAVPLDVLQHHDGVVDDEAGGEHDGEQRQDVEREAGEIDRRERADQRDRHGDGGDDRRAPRAQEEEDHGDDDQRRLAERLQHLLQRAADEGRRRRR